MMVAPISKKRYIRNERRKMFVIMEDVHLTLTSSKSMYYYDLVVCPKTGFSGYLSQLQYFSKALSVVEINSIVQKGPNLKDANQLNLGTSMPSNISTSWYNSFLK